MQGKKKIYSQTQSALVLLAGPVPGILIGFVLLEYGITENIFWVIQLGVLFVLLNVINLLPLDPLDGGQLIKLMFFGNQELGAANFFFCIFSWDDCTWLFSRFMGGDGIWFSPRFSCQRNAQAI